MAIDKKLIHFKEWNTFMSNQGVNGNYTTPSTSATSSSPALYGQIKETSIVFIQDVQKIWTHGKLYDCSTPDLNAYLTAEDLKTLNNFMNTSSVSKDGETLTVKINNSTQSLTNTWRDISDKIDGTSSIISASEKAVKSAYDLAASKTSNKGTVTSITPGTGLTGISSDTAITTTGTINLKTAGTGEIGGIKVASVGTAASGANTTVNANKFAVHVDSNGLGYVAIPQYSNNSGDITEVIAGSGLTGGANSGAATLNVGAGTGISVANDSVSVNLKSTTALTIDSTADTTTSGRVYPVAVDKSGYLAVNVPWKNDNTTQFTITASANDDDVVVLSGTNGTNATTYTASHAKTFGNTTAPYTAKYTSGNSTTSISGYGDSKTIKIPQITVDEYGHVRAGADEEVTITMPSAQTIPTLSGGSAAETGKYVSGVTVSGHAVTVTKGTLPTIPSSLKNPNALTFGSKTYDGSSAQTITAADLGLDSALKFHGTSSTAITDGSTTQTVTLSNGSSHKAENGCVLFYGNKEFVWNGSSWEELGNEGDYKVKQTAVSSPSASGSTTAFIDTISQNTNGVITVTKKNLAAATNSVIGGLKLYNAAKTTSITPNSASTNSNRYYAIELDKDGKAFVNVPWTDTDTNTTYSAGTGISLSGTTFSHADTNTNISADTSYGPTTDVTQSAKNNASFKVPQITLDQFGHVKSVTERTITVTDTNTDTDTHYTTGLYIGASGSKSNAITTNGSTYLKLYDNDTSRASFKISGSGTVSVTSDSSGNITITGTAHPTSLKNPNSISFKDASNTTKSYDGSSALDLTGGVYYAATANVLNINNTENKSVSRLQYFQKTNDTTINPDSGWWSLLRTQHAGYENGYWQEMAYSFSSDTVKYRRNVNGTKSAWKTFAFTDSDITGNASTATALTSSAGSATNPIYFSSGKPVACTYTLGKSVPSDAKFTDTDTWRTIQCNGTSIGSNTLNLKAGTNISLSNSNGTITISSTNTTYSAGTGLSLSGTTFSANGTSIINALTEGASPATREDFIVAQYAGGGTTTTTYHRRKLSHIFAALNKSDITTALGYTPPTSDTNTWRPIYNGVDSTATDTSASANAVKTAYDKALSAYNLANGKTSNTGTVTSVATGAGLTGGTISTSGTIKCNLNSETSLGTIGTTSKLYAVGVDANGKLCVNVPWSDNNTHYTSKNIVGTSATATSNGAVTGTGGVFLNHLEESTVKSTHKIVGAGTVKVTSDSSGNITITGTDTNTDTHYTTGINAGASGTTSNTAQTNPYITVKDNSTYRSQIQLVGGGGTTVTSQTNGQIIISSTSSTECNFTNAYKTKLDGIATGATNVTASTVTGWGFAKTDDLPDSITEATVANWGFVKENNHTHDYLSTSGGNISGNLTVTGTVSSTGGFFHTSDETLKNFIGDVEVDFDKLAALPKKYFTWKDGDNSVQIGTSAQEVQKVYPEIVNTDDTGKLSVDYTKLSVIALSAIDKLNEKNKELENRLHVIESLLSKLNIK